ncbi:hypothetical protein [Subtercola sp. YIM 133946]|uniref:hypothetical protein n=1 Tax=Subtercola sp. YIM 133946 TaxID=3118909 RepID=UPI002F93BEF1
MAKLDLSFIEVALELVPFSGRRTTVFRRGSSAPTTSEMRLIVPDDVLVKDGDVSLGGLYIEVAEERRTDMDREAVVDEVG